MLLSHRHKKKMKYALTLPYMCFIYHAMKTIQMLIGDVIIVAYLSVLSSHTEWATKLT